MSVFSMPSIGLGSEVASGPASSKPSCSATSPSSASIRPASGAAIALEAVDIFRAGDS